MTSQNLLTYKSALGYNDGLVFIRQILNGVGTTSIVNNLKDKTVKWLKYYLITERRTIRLKGKNGKSFFLLRTES